MKKDKTLKRLAEQHFFFGKTLNLKEAQKLGFTQADILKNTEGSESKEKSSNKRSPLRPGLDKKELLDLIDDVELEFNLDLSNPSPFKYKKLDTGKLKDFIRKYINTYFTDEDTLEHVSRIINREDLKGIGILYRLYASAGV